MKLALVVDKSQAFISFQRERIFTEWGADPKESKKVSRVQDAGGATLFGAGITSILELEDAEAVKSFVATVEGLSRAEVLNKISSGLFISTSVARTSTKKLETLVEKLGGEVILTTVPKGEKVTVAEKLISDLNLNRDTKTFLLAYVGDDYEAVIPLVKTLSTLTPEKQYGVSEDDIFVRLPQPPGAVPPWEIEKPLLEGNVEKAIELFRRVAEHSHYLVVLKILNNKFQSAYRVSALLTDKPKMSDGELAAATSVNPRQLWLYKKNHTTYGVEKLQRVVELLAKTEAQVKGGSGADSLVVMEAMLVRIAFLLRSR